MSQKDRYDWVVLGDHPGALLSAGLAARLGLSVLVLPLFSSSTLHATSDGTILDPESQYLLGLGRETRFSGLLSECLSRLGILPAEAEHIDMRQPLPQVLTPASRIAFDGDFRVLERELAREWGPELAAHSGWGQSLAHAQPELLSYWLQLPERLTLLPGKSRISHASPTNVRALRRRVSTVARSGASGDLAGLWWETRKKASFLGCRLETRGGPKAEDVVSSLGGLWYGITSNISSDPVMFDLLHLMAVARTGASYKGGMSAYREFLLRLAKRLGADVPAKERCQKIFVERGRLTGVQVGPSRGKVLASAAIIGCALDKLSDVIVSEGRSSWRNRLKRSPVPTHWRFTLSFTVKKEAIPPGATDRMVWSEAGARELEIEILEPADYGLRQSELRIVQGRALLPFHPDTLASAYQKKVSALILRQLSDIFPFFEDHLVSIFPDFRSLKAESFFAFKSLADIPENLRCVSPEDSRGVGFRSGIDGLFVSNGESFPRLGTLGPTVAAVEAVSWLAHRSGLAGPFA